MNIAKGTQTCEKKGKKNIKALKYKGEKDGIDILTTKKKFEALKYKGEKKTSTIFLTN